MFAGLSSIWRIPTLRRVLIFSTAMNTASAPFMLFALVELQQRGSSSVVIGLVTTGMAVGGLVGAGLVTPLHRRLAPGTLMLCQAAILALLMAAFAVPWGPSWLGAVLFLSTVAVPTMRVLVDIVIFRQAPEERRGRVVAGAMTVYGLGASAGLFCAGLLMEYLSVRQAALVMAGALAVAFVVGISQRAFRSTDWPPEPNRPGDPSSADSPDPGEADSSPAVARSD